MNFYNIQQYIFKWTLYVAVAGGYAGVSQSDIFSVAYSQQNPKERIEIPTLKLPVGYTQ